MKEKKRKLFVDLDGTLASFEFVSPSRLYEKGYFLNLEPNRVLIRALKDLHAKNIEIYILSSYMTDSRYALDEKQEWCDRNVPFIDRDHRLFAPCGISKADFICDMKGEVLSEEEILLDDYTKQLVAWSENGGTGIKYLNGINGISGTWKKMAVSNEELDILRDIFPEAV